MSFEYTIDIQLTELGFPVIEQTAGETLNPSASSEDSFSPCHKQKLISDEREAAKQTTLVSSPLSDTMPGKQSHPPEPDKATEPAKLCEHSENGPTAGLVTTDIPPLTAELEEDAAEVVDDDSCDSEVSGVYEEEDDMEEDGQSIDSGNSGDYRCAVCELQLPSKFKLQDHMNLHTGARPYCCAECGKRFCQIYNYRVHLRTHAQTKVDRLVCRVCLKGFASQEDLTNHLARTHLEDKFYECDLCKRVFTSLKACEYHVQLHKCMQSVVCQICGRSFSSSQALARHRRKASHHNFKCTDCSMIFTKKNALLKHSFSHLGLLPYTCIRCRCHFRLAKLYRQHKCKPESIHCVACLREFLSQEDFQRHKRDTGCWGNQEPNRTMDEIRCLECGQRFDTSEELKKHAGAHQRVLKCAECGKGFRSALLLMSHMGGHAGQSPCLCQSCGLGFPHQQNYDSHLKTCGQTPQSVSAAKKRPTTKSLLPKTKKHNENPDPLNVAKANKVSAPLNNSRCPESVTKSVSAGSGPSDGLWKLTLDKQPPPGVKIVLLIPVCPTQTNGLPPTSTVQQTLPVPPLHAVPGVAASNGHIGVDAAFRVPLNAPLDLSNVIQEDTKAPLDLSKKCSTFKSATADVPLIAVKSEPDEVEVSGEANNTASSAVLMDFKKEPIDFSPSNQLTDLSPKKDIKMEVDI